MPLVMLKIIVLGIFRLGSCGDGGLAADCCTSTSHHAVLRRDALADCRGSTLLRLCQAVAAATAAATAATACVRPGGHLDNGSEDEAGAGDDRSEVRADAHAEREADVREGDGGDGRWARARPAAGRDGLRACVELLEEQAAGQDRGQDGGELQRRGSQSHKALEASRRETPTTITRRGQAMSLVSLL